MRCLPLLLLVGCSSAVGDPAPAGPLVLELFTSQGCSSCPPADQLLSRLARAGDLGGRKLAPLAFHVDYWNDLGWTDPYSSPAWTERQRRYAAALRDRAYTPELVIGGAAGVVGSNLVAVTSAIASAPRPALLSATATWSPTSLEVRASPLPDADILVAIYEDNRRIRVLRGENALSTLSNDRIVRRLDRLPASGRLTIPLDPSWRPSGAVVFAQRPDLRIVASTLLPAP